MTASSDVLWTAGDAAVEDSRIVHFMRWLEQTRGLRFDGYPQLWRWSADEVRDFWAALWEYYGLDQVSGYDEVLGEESMPGARWFPGARVNFAERCLHHGGSPSAVGHAPGPGGASADEPGPAIVSLDEGGEPVEMSWDELRRQVAALASSFREMGVRPGDRVAACLPNTAHAVVGLLATAAVGATWTVCAPDFGTPSVLSRLGQAEPSVLLVVDGYRHGGKTHDRRDQVREIAAGLPGLRHVVVADHLGTVGGQALTGRDDLTEHAWDTVTAGDHPLEFEDVPFDHPLWILWSSGTTGLPKGIVQSHGGITLELLKAVGIGGDLRPDDRYFFVTSTSWMVWNFLIGGLLHGATIVLYNGSPTFPDIDGVWRVAERTGATVVGLGAAYLMLCEKSDAQPSSHLDLAGIRSIQQTGSSMPASTWHWVYEHISEDTWLNSIAGGTDICSVLVGGTLLLPVREARLQAPWLGAAVAAWDPAGRSIIGEQGELVVTKPMPSMPLAFLNDPDFERYQASYFDTYPGVWRHGDWIIMDEDLSVVITGRSDSTLNRQGIRMGSADLYAVVEELHDVADSLVVGVEQSDGGYFMPLFVVAAEGQEFDDDLRGKIVAAIRAQLSPRHVPDDIVGVAAIPRTMTGKKLEVPVKRIMQGASASDVSSEGAVTNPEMLDWFARYAADRAGGGSGK